MQDSGLKLNCLSFRRICHVRVKSEHGIEEVSQRSPKATYLYRITTIIPGISVAATRIVRDDETVGSTPTSPTRGVYI